MCNLFVRFFGLHCGYDYGDQQNIDSDKSIKRINQIEDNECKALLYLSGRALLRCQSSFHDLYVRSGSMSNDMDQEIVRLGHVGGGMRFSVYHTRDMQRCKGNLTDTVNPDNVFRSIEQISGVSDLFVIDFDRK